MLHRRQGSQLIAVEIESGLRRLEQQIRWANEKADGLESTELFHRASTADRPSVYRLLIIRSTRTNHDVARTFARTIEAAYPAPPRAVYAALTSVTPWPGAGTLWARVDGTNATILRGGPRGGLC